MDPNRRRFLAGLASAAASSGLAGCGFPDAGDRWPGGDGDGETDRPGTPGDAGTDGAAGTPGSDATRRDRWAPEFESVVDVVDAGATPDGAEPIDPVLRSRAGEDVLFYFPPGRYRMTGNWNRDAFSRIGLVGDEATIRPVDEPHDTMFTLGQPDRAGAVVLAGIDFDFQDLANVPRPFIARVDDELVVRDVSVRGPSRAVRVDVNDPDGTGLVERLSLTDSPDDVFAVGCLVTDETRGAVTFRDCIVRGFPNNGLYASSARGPIRVLGGTYANNGIANVRVSGDSVVRGVTVVCDRTDARFPNMRGIWLRHGSDALIEDCEVRFRRVSGSDGALVVAGSGTVRDTTVRVDADDVTGVEVTERTKPAGTDDGVAFENLTVTGRAADGSAIRVADRRGCSFDALRVRQTGASRDGLRLIRATETALRDAEVLVTGEPIYTEDATIETSDVRTATDVATLGARRDSTE